MTTLLSKALILLLLVPTCAGCSKAKYSADLEAARTCTDAQQVLERTHDWFGGLVADDKSLAVASLKRKDKVFTWKQGNEETDADAAGTRKKIQEALAGKPGKLVLQYAATPRRGTFVVHLSAEGKVTSVDDFQAAD